MRGRALAPLLLSALISGCATPGDAVSPSRDDFGVLVMAHGGPAAWNEAVSGAVAPLRDRYRIEVAFGMADATTLEAAVQRLEARGARRIGVVRLFVSGESWHKRTEQILGLAPGAPPASAERGGAGHHAGHGMAYWRVDTLSSFAMSTRGLIEAPEMGPVLADRAQALSRDPAREDVLILAHGPGDDAENERWLAHLQARAEAVRQRLPFRRVEVATLREDWPKKRIAAEQHVRAFVARATAEGGTAIVLPFRVVGFGPYAKLLTGLDYVSDRVGLIPHPNVTQWIEEQIEQLRTEGFREARRD